MDIAVLDPSILYITETEWLNEDTRDDYLKHFNSMLSGIDENKNISLAWCDEFDDLFWSSPQKLPWKQDKYWSITLMPIIYAKIQKNAKIVEIPAQSSRCDINPDFKYDRDDLYTLFLIVLAILNNNCCCKILMCLGRKNIPHDNHAFTVDGQSLIPAPSFVTCSQDFLKLIDVEENYWPRTIDDSKHLKDGIYIILKRDYYKDQAICNFSFSNGFIEKLINTDNDKDKILKAIAKRLTMTKAAAGRDGSLQDETLKGDSSGIRRFRVTPRPTSKRIHYKNSSGNIEFMMFYDEGEHDDGL